MSGLRKGRSNIDNVIALATHVKDGKIRRHIAIAVFTDINSVYKRVLHEAIRTVMRSAGIAGRMYDWMSDYFPDRSIYMSVAGGETSPHNVTHGVPQITPPSSALRVVCGN
ncbi:hypothetical protein HPB48_002941 [Haemaphysalis longicornis]|uniref:Reverse transcriptase domain-containing protein n=1 Tax=Haemaphysalis longicornis TaxID=44386 RepID=A0A9J6FEE5_HAELO|nr:hypothetical protein HPB48_002941 [Haemaphysalis longicornis]